VHKAPHEHVQTVFHRVDHVVLADLIVLPGILQELQAFHDGIKVALDPKIVHGRDTWNVGAAKRCSGREASSLDPFFKFRLVS